MSEHEQAAEGLMALASVAAPYMRLADICLIDAHVHREAEVPTSPDARLKCNFGFKVDHGFQEETKHLVAVVQFFSKGRFQEQDDEKLLFKVEAAYTVAYVMEGIDTLPKQTIEAFAKMNGVYNCWPYWREFLQSSAVRMGIPAVTLPLITGTRIEEIFKRKSSVESDSEADQKSIESGAQEPP